MSKSSNYIKRWRAKVKEIIVKCMGDCCQICSYNKCSSALELHHINPGEKDISFGFILASCRNWNVIYSEISKCILLCANCHREIHANIANIPEVYAKFDANLADDLRGYYSLKSQKSIAITSKQTKIKNEINNKKSKIRLKEKHKIDFKKEKTDHRKFLLLNSDIDFNKSGWAKKASNIVGISEQKLRKWMKKYMTEFHNSCYNKRKQGS